LSKLNVEAAILCDDVRTEINGKPFLIGVYLKTIVVQGFPANINVCIWIQFSPEELGSYAGEIRLIDKSNHLLLSGQFTIDVKEMGSSVMSVPKTAIALGSEGDYELQWKYRGGDWEVLKRVKVTKGEVKK
jgi:hypothetical protein